MKKTKIVINENDLIRNFMGFKYHEIVDIDYSDCGGIYTKTNVYSKIPISVEKYDDQCYFKEDWSVNKGDAIYGDLRYDYSWDSLMSVLEYIESLGYRSSIQNRADFHEMLFFDPDVSNNLLIVAETYAPAIDEDPHIAIAWINNAEHKTKFEVVYRAIVNLIKYHNQAQLISNLND